MNNYFFEYTKNHEIQLKNYYKDLFWNFIVLKDKMNEYYNKYNDLYKIHEYLNKKNKTYSDEYLIKNILQNDYKLTPIEWVEKANQRLIKAKKECFEYLNKFDNAYKAIFDIVWFVEERKYENGFYPYNKSKSGVTDISLFVAGEYAKTKINNNGSI